MNSRLNQIFFFFVILVLTTLISCSKNSPPNINITQPSSNLTIYSDTTLSIIVDASDDDGKIERLCFVINESEVKSISSKPYKFDWKISRNMDLGRNLVKVIAYDNDNSTSIDSVIITVEDYRIKFYGNYFFTTKEEIWEIGSPWKYHTHYYHGLIRKYKANDSDNDLCQLCINANLNPDYEITIEFLNNKKITSVIAQNGHLLWKSGYHYDHLGSFVHPDTIVFQVTGLGALGGGVNYYVKGVRE